MSFSTLLSYTKDGSDNFLYLSRLSKQRIQKAQVIEENPLLKVELEENGRIRFQPFKKHLLTCLQ